MAFTGRAGALDSRPANIVLARMPAGPLVSLTATLLLETRANRGRMDMADTLALGTTFYVSGLGLPRSNIELRSKFRSRSDYLASGRYRE